MVGVTEAIGLGFGALDILKRLGSGVRPDGASARGPEAPVERRGFGELLDQVRGGGLGSGRGIEFPGGAELELSDAERAALSEAADAAEAAGAQTLVAVVGGSRLTIDVATRRVASVDPVSRGDVMTGADAFVVIGEDGVSSAGGAGDGLSGLPGGMRNASLASLLARSGGGGRGNG